MDIKDVPAEVIEAYRKKWLDIGLCCDEAEWNKASDLISKIYIECGLGAPTFVRCRSVIEASIARAALMLAWNAKQPGGLTLKNVAAKLNSFHGAFSRDIGEDSYAKIEDGKQFNSWDSPHHTEMREFAKKFTLELYGNADISVFDSTKYMRESISDVINNCFWGQHEWWLPYYCFPRDHLGSKYEESDARMLELWEELARVSGWWSSYSEIVIQIDRPLQQHLNDGWLVHNESGPAVLHGDGFRYYMIENNRVDEQIVMRPETQTVEQINREENQDIRSIRIERFGWPRYLKESGATVVDRRHNEIENTHEVLMRTTSGDLRLLVTCPTKRMFAMGVPSNVTTCAEAQSYLAGPAARGNVIART